MKPRKRQNKKVDFISSKENLKYISRCHYYGRLKDIEYISNGMVLKFEVYTATQYYGGNTVIRVYVPSDLEKLLEGSLEINERYYILAAPYKVRAAKEYVHRVDLLLNIFKELY